MHLYAERNYKSCKRKHQYWAVEISGLLEHLHARNMEMDYRGRSVPCLKTLTKRLRVS
jgi:hypothetical protein